MRYFITIFLIHFFSFSFSQVTWTFSAKSLGDKKYELHLVASVAAPWHIYSQVTPPGGPLPTVFSMDKNPLVLPVGTAKEVGKLTTKHEEVFGVDVKYYNTAFELVQVVTLKAKVKSKVTGTVEYMVCNDTQCLPPKKLSFSINVK